jgi:hypothetical protein
VQVAGKGTRIEDDKVKFFGFSFDEEADDGSKNKMIFYKCYITDFPEIATKTISGDDTAMRDYILSVKMSPVFYDKVAGGKGLILCKILNSADDAGEFTANNTTIVYPVEAVVAE